MGAPLIRDDDALPTVESSTILTVRCTSIRRFGKQPRTEFDPARIDELAASLKEHGQQVAIIVRQLPKPDGDVLYEIIDGERRWRAARVAGLPTIRCEVRGARNVDHQFVQSVVANFGREDHSPIEAAEAVARVAAMPEYASLPVLRMHERLGVLFARSGHWAKMQLDVMALPEGVRAMVALPKGERLSTQLALFIGTIQDAEEQVRVAEYIVRREVPPAKARLLVSAAREKHGKKPEAAKTNPSTEVRNIFAHVQRIKSTTEVLLDMPRRGLRAVLQNNPGTAKELVRVIDETIEALRTLREGVP